MAETECDGFCMSYQCEPPVQKVAIAYGGVAFRTAHFCQRAIRVERERGFEVTVIDGPPKQEQPE